MHIFPLQNCEHVEVYIMYNMCMCMSVHILFLICIITSEHVGKKSPSMWPYSIVGVPEKNIRFQLV